MTNELYRKSIDAYAKFVALAVAALLLAGCAPPHDQTLIGEETAETRAIRFYQADAAYNKGYLDGAMATGYLPSQGAK